MSIAIQDFYYETGEEAAAITAIKTVLALAGWVQTTSDGFDLYRSALANPNGKYAYVYLMANDGNGKIGIAVGADTGTDDYGMSRSAGSQIGLRSCQAVQGHYRVWASERWFLMYPTNPTYADLLTGLLGGGLYFPLYELGGDSSLFAIGSQAFNSATTYDKPLFDVTGAGVTSAWMNDWWGTYLTGLIPSMASSVPAQIDLPSPFAAVGQPFNPVALAAKSTVPYGYFGCLYDAYVPHSDPYKAFGIHQGSSFDFNGWTYAGLAGSPTHGFDWFTNGYGGGPLFLRFRAVP